MGYMFRYNPAVVLLRRAIARGWLGELFEVHAVMSKLVEPVDEQAGGVFGRDDVRLGCHLIDLIVTLLGKPGSVTPFLQHNGEAADTLLDNALAVLRYPRALASVNARLEVEGEERRRLVVCGTRGTFHIEPLDNPSARVTFAAAPKATTEVTRW